MNELNAIQWRDPTQEEVDFIQKHWLPELNACADTNWRVKRVQALENGNFQVARAKSWEIALGRSDNGHIHAKLNDGTEVLFKKPGFSAERMFIDFPIHFTHYFVNRGINDYPVLMIKLPECQPYMAVPAREWFA